MCVKDAFIYRLKLNFQFFTKNYEKHEIAAFVALKNSYFY